MILAVDPSGLRSVAAAWEEASLAASSQRATVTSVGGGAENFGRINQFMTPALAGFVALAVRAAEECGELWQEGALAATDTATDLVLVDEAVARAMGGQR